MQQEASEAPGSTENTRMPKLIFAITMTEMQPVRCIGKVPGCITGDGGGYRCRSRLSAAISVAQSPCGWASTFQAQQRLQSLYMFRECAMKRAFFALRCNQAQASFQELSLI